MQLPLNSHRRLPSSRRRLPRRSQSSRITKNTYDLAGQLTKVTEGLGTADEADEATYAYTVNGKREFLTDARGYKAQFVYDDDENQYCPGNSMFSS